MTFGEFRFGVNKEGSYRLEVPISSEFSAIDSDFSSSDEEFSSPRFVDTKASGKLAKIFSDTSFESSADSVISSDSDSADTSTSSTNLLPSERRNQSNSHAKHPSTLERCRAILDKEASPSSIDSWDSFEDIFVKNFRSTCKKPASLEELRACRQKHDESMRKYIQRWNIIKNSAEDISDERAIDAFVAGIRRGDFVEDLGRTNPKTISALMEIANKWADGEDAIYNKQHRSPEEDHGNPGGNSRDDYQRSNEQQSDSRGDFRGNRQNSGPRFQRPYVSPEEMMNGPCQMHFYLDNNGKRQSSQKDCRNFQAMLRAAGIANAQAMNRNQGPRSEIHLPPPPAITDENRHQLRIAAAPHPPPYVDPNSNGAVSMIHKARPSNRAQKVISQVFMAEKMPPPTVEYLNWSGQDIGFTIADHPQQVPRPGQSALILPAVIAGFDVSRVFIDGGSSLNLMYADTLRKMNISLANLKPTDTRFHGITPEKPSYPLGKINLDVQFGTRENYRIENLELEVVDFPSQYHALLGRPAYVRPPPRLPFRLYKAPASKPHGGSHGTRNLPVAAIAAKIWGTGVSFRHPRTGSAPGSFSIDTAAISTTIFITAAAPMKRE
ncbi:hypothetical protein QYE76_011545 [Lolium multiflorum]|uniref:Retrotransposon gag domain-containing protein n=1 Tax=Lolium multiflorum TaxID=4521 RepID=A0AAD8X2U7_LOLMU|nr:hypothetical protein QYE76_011545 [Lolium multiflorum]